MNRQPCQCPHCGKPWVQITSGAVYSMVEQKICVPCEVSGRKAPKKKKPKKKSRTVAKPKPEPGILDILYMLFR